MSVIWTDETVQAFRSTIDLQVARIAELEAALKKLAERCEMNDRFPDLTTIARAPLEAE